MPEGFVFSGDSRYLYGSSYYTGVSNIYRYDLALGKLEAVSNAEIGYFGRCRSTTSGCSSSTTRPTASCRQSSARSPRGPERDHVPR